MHGSHMRIYAQLHCINVPIVLDIIPCTRLHKVMSKCTRYLDKFSLVNHDTSYIYTYVGDNFYTII